MMPFKNKPGLDPIGSDDEKLRLIVGLTLMLIVQVLAYWFSGSLYKQWSPMMDAVHELAPYFAGGTFLLLMIEVFGVIDFIFRRLERGSEAKNGK